MDYCCDNKFEVRTNGGSQYGMNLNTASCGCRRWNLTGLPYVHVIAYIDNRGLNFIYFVNACYKKKAYEKAYVKEINPMNRHEEWRKTGHLTLEAPAGRNIPGGPKKARRRPPDEI